MHDQRLRDIFPSFLFLVFLLFFSMFSRLIFSPLLISIEEELHISTTVSSQFFLYMSVGTVVAVVLSGVLVRWLRHKEIMTLSGLCIAFGLLSIGLAGRLPVFQLAFVMIGIGAGLFPASEVPALAHSLNKTEFTRSLTLLEVGPSAAFVLAPLVASFAFVFPTWRHFVVPLSVIVLLTALLHQALGKLGKFHGESISFAGLRGILGDARFWYITFFIVCSVGGTMGVFSILPTFLTKFHNFAPSDISLYMMLARLGGIVILLPSSFLIRRSRTLVVCYMLLSAIATFLLGVAEGAFLKVVVVLQPAFMVPLIPYAFSYFREIGSHKVQNLIIACAVILIQVVSLGIYTPVMGWLVDSGIPYRGFQALGVIIAVGYLLMYWLLRRRLS